MNNSLLHFLCIITIAAQLSACGSNGGDTKVEADSQGPPIPFLGPIHINNFDTPRVAGNQIVMPAVINQADGSYSRVVFISPDAQNWSTSLRDSNTTVAEYRMTADSRGDLYLVESDGTTVTMRRSKDFGSRWSVVTSSLANSSQLYLTDVDLSTSNWFATGYREVQISGTRQLAWTTYRSTDFGQNWSVSDAIDPAMNSSIGKRILAAGGLLIAGGSRQGAPSGSAEIRISNDQGETWQTASTFTGAPGSNATISDFQVSVSGQIYAIGFLAANLGNKDAILVQKSTTNGLSWSAPNQIVATERSIQLNSSFISNEDLILCTTVTHNDYSISSQILKSTDNGSTWSSIRNEVGRSCRNIISFKGKTLVFERQNDGLLIVSEL